MQKGNRYRWLWILLLLSYKYLMVKGQKDVCFCRQYRPCLQDQMNVDINERLLLGANRYNVALGKKASQSGHYQWDGRINADSCANDGNRTMIIPPGDYTCIFTDPSAPSQFYQIDLGRSYPIAFFMVYFRIGTGLQDFRNRHVETELLLDNNRCADFTGDYIFQYPERVTCPKFPFGQWIRMQRQASRIEGFIQMDQVLNICEVEAWACWPGFYGEWCNMTCLSPRCGQNKACNPKNGACDIPLEEDTQRPLPPVPGLVLGTLGPTTEAVFEEARSSTKAPPPEESCLNWIYAGCIILFFTLAGAGNYLFLSSKANEEKETQKDEEMAEDVEQGENQAEDEGAGTEISEQ